MQIRLFQYNPFVISLILAVFIGLSGGAPAQDGCGSAVDAASVMSMSPDNGDSRAVKYMAVVLDRTGSMTQTRSTGNTRGEDALAAAKTGVVNFFDKVPNGRVVVTTFASSNFNYLTSGFVGEAEALAALDTLNGQTCTGNTRLADAIQIFCDYLETNAPTAPQDYRIMAVYTDGDENSSTGICSGPDSTIGPPPAGNYSTGSWQQKCWDYCLDKHTMNVVYWGLYRGGEEGFDPDTDIDTGRAVSDEAFFQDLSQSNGGTYVQCGDHQSLQLSLSPDQPIAGKMASFIVNDADPAEPVFLAYSTKGMGSTTVPMLNVTLDLDSPKQAGPSLTPDPAGTAAWTIKIPASAAGVTVWFQVVQGGQPEGKISNTANPIIVNEQAGVYRYDDGSSENLWGWSTGGDMCWMHAFDAVAGGETITSVQTMFGSFSFPGLSPGNGTACEVFIWNDPTNDYDPSDCILLASEASMVQNVDTDMLNKIMLSSPVTVSGVFFVGCVLTHGAGQYVAPTDETTSYVWGNAYFCGTTVPGGFDAGNLMANQFKPADIGNFWCLRGGY